MNDELYFISHTINTGDISGSVIMWRAGMFSSFLEADETCRELFYDFLDGDLDKHASIVEEDGLYSVNMFEEGNYIFSWTVWKVTSVDRVR